ncbi:MAG: ABC transporter permease subunit [Haloarculaceae archaeon]
MLETTRYEARRRSRGALVLAVLLGVFALLVVGLFPSISQSGADLQAFIESLPPAFREGFIGTTAYNTLPGFLSTEFYQFVWLLLLGLYMAYAAGAVVAGDVETGRLDLVLAAPVSRKRVLVEKYLSLLAPIVVLNLVVPLFVYGGVVAIGESLDVVDLLTLHVLSVPYLLVCAGLGLVLSVAVDRADLAQRGGIGLVFGLFLLDTVTTSTDYEWLGTLSPTRYYSPVDVLVDQSYDVTGALLLFLAAVALVVLAVAVFRRRDV